MRDALGLIGRRGAGAGLLIGGLAVFFAGTLLPDLEQDSILGMRQRDSRPQYSQVFG